MARRRCEDVNPAEMKKQLKKINDDYKKKKDQLTDQLTEKLSDILLGEKIPLDVVNAQSGEIIIPANRKITKTLLRKLAAVYDHIEIDPSPIRNKILEIISSFEGRSENLMLTGSGASTRSRVGMRSIPVSSRRSRSS